MTSSGLSSPAVAVLDRYQAWRDRERDRVGPAGSDGRWTPARFVFEAVTAILDGAMAEVALDPWSTCGLILASLVESGRARCGVGVCRTSVDHDLARHLVGALPIEWLPQVGMFERERDGNWALGLDAERAAASFDLVVSMPPWNLRAPGGERDPSGVDDFVPHLVLLRAWQRLKPGGVGVAILPPAFAIRRGSVGQRLGEFGLHLDAVIELPPGSFAPSTQVGAAIVVVRPGPPCDVFAARLNGDAGHDSTALANFHKRRMVSEDPSLGLLISPTEFRGVGPALAQARRRRQERRTGLQAVPLRELLTAVQMGRANLSFQEEADAVYLPLTGRREAVTRVPDLELKPQNYAQLRVQLDRVDPEWLAGYLSSPEGLEARESHSSGAAISRLTRDSIGEIHVFVPPLVQQIEAAAAYRSASPIRDEVHELGRSVWTDARASKRLQALTKKLDSEASFVGWIDQLPFPLASILWAYQAAGSDAKARYEHLLFFFEAQAEFLSLVLLSAVVRQEDTQRDLLADLRKAFEQGGISFDRATFATWRTTASVLTKGLRKIRGGEGGEERLATLLKTSDRDVFEMLLAKGMASVLEKVNTYRNEWKGHGGVVGPDEAHRRHQLLLTELGAVRTIVGDAWTRYPLVLPVVNRYKGGMHHYELRRVMGRAAPFEQFEAAVATPLDDGQLHLLGADETQALPLLPLVRLGASPTSAENACYFYNKRVGPKVSFVSYHFEKEASLQDTFPEVTAALARLTSGIPGDVAPS